MANTSLSLNLMDPIDFVSDLSLFRPEIKMGFTTDYKKQCEFDLSGVDTIATKSFQSKINDISGGSKFVLIGFSNTHLPGASLDEDLHWQLSTTNIVSIGFNDMTAGLFGDAVMNAELTKGIVEGIEDQESETETDWHCKGCTKYFATKGSLKRHHDRKVSCKDICEKNLGQEIADIGLNIFDWVEQTLQKAVSGDSDKPYCKHCDVEFANKSNLNKHITKSPACDKLAKSAFLELSNEIKELPIKKKEHKKQGWASPFNISSRLATSVAVSNSLAF